MTSAPSQYTSVWLTIFFNITLHGFGSPHPEPPEAHCTLGEGDNQCISVLGFGIWALGFALFGPPLTPHPFGSSIPPALQTATSQPRRDDYPRKAGFVFLWRTVRL